MIPKKSQISADLDKKVLAEAQDGSKKMVVIGEMGYYRVKWTRGGRLPDGLEGKFTSRQIAEEKVALWVARRK